MKTVLSLTLLFCLCTFCNQVERKQEKCDQFVVHPEKLPAIIGGAVSAQEKINYPKLAEEKKIEGTVYVQFVVSKKGNVLEPEIAKGVHKILDKEVIRGIKEMKFEPAIKNGKAACFEYGIPITFKLDK